MEELEIEAEYELRKTAEKTGATAEIWANEIETIEDIDLGMLEQNKIEKWLGLEAKSLSQTSTGKTATDMDREINQEKQIEEEI